MAKPTIGFIGLGLMGSAMCRRLLDLDYPLMVLANRSRKNIENLIERGASEVKSAKELAEKSNVVMLCMDTSASVESRMLGDQGVIAGLKKDAVAIDFGTSLPASTRAIGEAVKSAGGTYLDAPLGRTPAHAEEGKLNIMCAGDKTAYHRVEPVLQDLGENVFHLGKLGTGHTLKLINNFFGMTTASAMSEAFAMADLAGVDRVQLYEVMSSGPSHSMMMDFVKANAVDGNPDMLAFSIRNARKDIDYYMSMADEIGAVSLVSPSTKQALGLAVANKYGDQMVSQMVDFFADLYAKDKSA